MTADGKRPGRTSAPVNDAGACVGPSKRRTATAETAFRLSERRTNRPPRCSITAHDIAREIFEERELRLQEGEITERFEARGARVYEW